MLKKLCCPLICALLLFTAAGCGEVKEHWHLLAIRTQTEKRTEPFDDRLLYIPGVLKKMPALKVSAEVSYDEDSGYSLGWAAGTREDGPAMKSRKTKLGYRMFYGHLAIMESESQARKELDLFSGTGSILSGADSLAELIDSGVSWLGNLFGMGDLFGSKHEPSFQKYNFDDAVIALNKNDNGNILVSAACYDKEKSLMLNAMCEIEQTDEPFDRIAEKLYQDFKCVPLAD